MTQIPNNININQHYSSNPKVQKPKPVVVTGPQSLPSRHVFNDTEANRKIAEVNRELNQKSKREKAKNSRNFMIAFGGIVLTVLAALGLKRILR